MKEKELTQSELESLSIYLATFKKSFYFATGKNLNTTQEIIDEVLKGTFTLEDMFYVHMDSVLDNGSKESYTWEDYMEEFQYENYFPGEKHVRDGAWIQIRTEQGYEVHYAKTARRKRRFGEEITAKYSKIINLTKRLTRDLTSIEAPSKSKDKKDLKVAVINKEIDKLQVYQSIDMKLYEVVIKRTKNKTEYYLPYQYEIVEDLDELTAAVMDGVPGIEVKTRPQGDMEDKVFYLRSRGIPEDLARLMAGLNQTYFKVNIELMLEIYNRAFSKIVLVKS